MTGHEGVKFHLCTEILRGGGGYYPWWGGRIGISFPTMIPTAILADKEDLDSPI